MSRPLSLSPAEFRELSMEVAELAAEFLSNLGSAPAFPSTSGAETAALFDAPAPERGIGRAAFDGLSDVLAHARPPSPRFFGYVFGSGEPVAAIGDALASVMNQNVTAWRSAPAAVTIERTVIRWIAEAIGCGGFAGSLTGGGSSANLMGLAMAREAVAPANEQGVQGGVAYASTEVHMSIPKAVALLGMGRRSLRLIPVDEELRMRADALERAMEADARAGSKPVAVVASAGTVSTGSIDPLDDIAAIAKRYGAWLHVDGAYGALAAMAAPELFAGLARADSLSLDPHKWLYQPADCGCLLYRAWAAARAAFAHTGDYAKVLEGDPLEGFAFFEESAELSRRFRALKLWLSLRYHGLDAFRRSIRDDLALAQHLAERIRREPSLELLAPVPLSAVCFRSTQGGAEDLNARNAAILQRVIRRGRVYLSNAVIRGQFALRACIVNHRTTEADVEAVVREVLEAASEIRG